MVSHCGYVTQHGNPSLLLFLTTTGALLELAREDTQKQQYSNLRKWSYPRVRIARMTLGLDHDPETDDCMPRACQKVYSRSMQQTFFCLLRADVLHSCGTTNTAYMEFERVLVASVPRHSKVSPFVHNPPAFGDEIGAKASRLGGVW